MALSGENTLVKSENFGLESILLNFLTFKSHKIVLVDLLKYFSIFRKWTIHVHVPSESTIKPTGNCIDDFFCNKN